jgi:hypothetical protein
LNYLRNNNTNVLKRALTALAICGNIASWTNATERGNEAGDPLSGRAFITPNNRYGIDEARSAADQLIDALSPIHAQGMEQMWTGHLAVPAAPL